MQDRKALDIAVIDLRELPNAIADFFIICSGNSDTQVDAIADSVEELVYKKTHSHAWRKEGKTNREWVLIDYADCVAHVFKKEKRQFYGLEELWGEAHITFIDEEA